MGRFLQTDPVGTQDDLNPYGYAANDALNSSDPHGTVAQACALNPGTCAKLLEAAVRLVVWSGAAIAATPLVMDAADAIGGAINSMMDEDPNSSSQDSGSEKQAGNSDSGNGGNNNDNRADPSKPAASEGRPKGTPESYEASPTKKGGGTKYSEPGNPHESVRDMPGNPSSPNPAQRNPYVKQMRDGQALDRFGNPVDPKSPEAHIPREDFTFHPK